MADGLREVVGDVDQLGSVAAGKDGEKEVSDGDEPTRARGSQWGYYRM